MIKQALTSVDDPIRRLHRTAYAPSRRMQMMRARSRLRSFFLGQTTRGTPGLRVQRTLEHVSCCAAATCRYNYSISSRAYCNVVVRMLGASFSQLK